MDEGSRFAFQVCSRWEPPVISPAAPSMRWPCAHPVNRRVCFRPLKNRSTVNC